MEEVFADMMQNGGVSSSTDLATLDTVKSVVEFDDLNDFESQFPCF